MNLVNLATSLDTLLWISIKVGDKNARLKTYVVLNGHSIKHAFFVSYI